MIDTLHLFQGVLLKMRRLRKAVRMPDLDQLSIGALHFLKRCPRCKTERPVVALWTVRIHACALLLQRLQGHLYGAAFPVPHNSDHYGLPYGVFVQDIHEVTRRLHRLSSNTNNDVTKE